MTHYHVAYGLTGYGPDGADGFATFETLSDALSYARDELSQDVDMASESAHYFGDQGDFEAAWRQIELMESLELLRANLDPSRRSAPLYVDNPTAYAAMQDEQWSHFPHDVSDNTRLYLWDCDESECEHYAEYLENTVSGL